ncbi:hypothetical protein F2Q70_00002182 [Brassica cretica]|uniref:Uncharacterized protein n=1 Tax=Brassica cretica TaxID=69181 RepID=A0A8S9IXG6_BRACR|nr:hypothetical protein F2Q70_00002182 [Brassica cretica]
MIQESLQLATVEPSTIDTHPIASIDSGHPKLTDVEGDKSVDTCPDEWENDYYNPTIATYTRQNMHTDENAPSIDMTSLPSIDTQSHQRCRKRASTDAAYYKSIDTEVHHAQEEAAWEKSRFSHPIDREIRSSIDTRHQQSIDTRHQQSIDNNNATSIDNRPILKTTVSEKDKLDNQYLTPDELGIFRDPDGYTKAIDGRTLHVSREDILDILQTANGADNLFMHQRSNPEQKATKEFYDTAGGIDNGFIQRSRHTTQPSIDVDIYTKDKINEMFYGVCGEHERNKEAFQMKLDGVYNPLNDSISWLTTCIEEMKQNIARIQHATDVTRPPSIDSRLPPSIDRHHRTSIDNRLTASIDGSPPRPHTMKSQPDFHTREEIDQLVEGIYRALETT